MRADTPQISSVDPTVRLRDPLPGDLGWIVEQHGRHYAAAYGWDATFEADVADVVARFARRFDPATDRCWIAEAHGARVGSIVVVRKSARVAQLRLFFLANEWRGTGLGGRMIDAAIAFAEARGYRRMMLWTNDIHVAARALYVRRGFEITRSEPYTAYGGHALVRECWERLLRADRSDLPTGRF